MAEENEFVPEQGMLEQVVTLLHSSESHDKNVIMESQRVSLMPAGMACVSCI
jgi:hypothetical protein